MPEPAEALRLPDPVLVVLVGVAGSGKSTWAAEHAAADEVVSSDQLRAVVGEGEGDLAASADAFDLLDRILDARLRRRVTTIVDTLGLDADRRRQYRALAARHGVPCVAIVLDTPPAEARRRNATRGKRVPVDVLRGQLAAFAAAVRVLPGEGFAELLTAGPVRFVAPAVAAAARRVAAVAPEGGQARPALRLGLHLSSFPSPGGPPLGERLRDVAVRAEAAGFDSLWVMDHLRQIPQVGRAWEDLPESVATLAHLAAATTTATVGCLVHCVTFRHPGVLAKSLATLDVLSGGRAWCGLGAGWFAAEHAAYGIPFPPARERLDLLEETLQALPLLWGPGSPAFEGAHVRIPQALAYPRPLRGRLPVLVGGGGERRTLRLAARYADACNVTGDADTLRRKVRVLRGHCADVGRDPAAVEVTHLSTALVAADPTELAEVVAARRPARGHARWAAATNPGTVDDHVLRVRDLVDAGAQHVIVALDGVWDLPVIERYGEVISRSRGS
ncbi:MAG: TIGR03560 family F420-dependent LLM class oxidoreductase [Kineosporiaceae bacterium]